MSALIILMVCLNEPFSYQPACGHINKGTAGNLVLICQTTALLLAKLVLPVASFLGKRAHHHHFDGFVIKANRGGMRSEPLWGQPYPLLLGQGARE